MARAVPVVLILAVLILAGVAQAQNTTTLSVNIGPEAALTVIGSSTTLTSSGGFAADYTGTTNFTYKIRTTKTTGTGSVTLKVTTDFNGTGGPSVANSGTTGDTLSYTSTLSAPGTAQTGTQTASTTASTPVGSFGAGVNSTKAGNSGSVSWDLINDPAYAVGAYTATVTFTISAT